MFSKISAEGKEQAASLFMELLEEGCFFHLLSTRMPNRPEPLDVIDISWLRKAWLNEQGRWAPRMSQADKEFYGGRGALVAEYEWKTRMDPFYKSHGLGGGFLGKDTLALSGHTRLMFFRGARLALMYDVSSNQRGKLIPPS